jgi:ribosomal protein S18 acetylase RimI-like enzyme
MRVTPGGATASLGSSAVEISSFREEHVEPAAELLAERHAAHRAAEPLLTSEPDFRAEVEALWAKDGASGAFCADGYILGTRLGDLWGPNAWVELAGHAVRRPELVRDLYAATADRWVAEGRTRHYAYVPNDAELFDAWFRVGFGAQHAFGIRSLAEPDPPLPSGVVARPAEERDLEAMVTVGLELRRHQSLSPVFADFRPDDEDELREEIRGDLQKPEIGNLVAEVDGRVVGNFVVVPIELSGAHVGLARPPALAHLGYAAVLPDARGSGAGLALTAASFQWARDRGYEAMVTDWRVTNLLSSRFWPKRGFRTTFLRLYRSIP